MMNDMGRGSVQGLCVVSALLLWKNQPILYISGRQKLDTDFQIYELTCA